MGMRIGLAVVLALLVVVADLGTWSLNALSCGLGENPTEESVRFCDADLHALPLVGAAYVLGAGILAAVTRNLSILNAGTGVGAALGLSVWVSSDPQVLSPLMSTAIVVGGVLAVAIPLLALRARVGRAG